MGIPLYERFAAMVERLPTKAVVSAVELERQMLEDDLERKRTLPILEARSIMAFASFLEDPNDALRWPSVHVPIEHMAFYRATVKRLVEAGEMPYETAAYFDRAFAASISKAA